MTQTYEKGMNLLNKLHGKHTGEALMSSVGEISQKLTNMGIEWVFGDIMQDGTLDLKTRELTIIASLITQNALAAQIKAHIEAALNIGTSKKEIIALIEQLAIYAGFPSANNAMLVAKEVFLEFKNC